ncbi:MAG: FAD-dependent oxidoreductase [Chloroflexi bacterium]|nr:FAD-dependent oxidoreductase [Chloroflexota bacterium]
MKIVIIGGGAAGFSAAMVARKTGADEVLVIERTDMLGGIALVAGIGIFGNGALVGLTEERAFGGASLYDEVFYPIVTHERRNVPGLGTTMLYNINKLDAMMQSVLKQNRIEVMLSRKVVDTEIVGHTIKAAVLEGGNAVKGDVFIDTTGSSTGIPGCTRFGYGCVGCILRCPTFGNPQGVADKKVKTITAKNALGTPGQLGTSVLIPIVSLSAEYQKQLKARGWVSIAVPPDAVPNQERALKAGSRGIDTMNQESLRQNLLILDIGGYVKVTANGSALYAGSLRKFPGLENSTIAQPMAGAKGHLVFGLSIAPRNNALEVASFDNLLCAGLKAGNTNSLLDAVVSGDLAGYNAVRKAKRLKCLEIPRSLAVGAFIDYVWRMMGTEEGIKKCPTMENINILKSLGVYRKKAAILKEVEKAGLTGIYSRPLS